MPFGRMTPDELEAELVALIASHDRNQSDRATQIEIARLYIQRGDGRIAESWYASADALAAPLEQELLARIDHAITHKQFDFAWKLLSARTWTQSEAWRLWSQSLREAKKYPEAILKAEEGIKKFPGMIQLHYALVLALFRDEQHVRAAKDCQTFAVESKDLENDLAAGDRVAAGFYNTWGNVLFALRRYPEAREKFRRAAIADKTRLSLRYNVAVANLALDDWYEAASGFREVIKDKWRENPLSVSGLATAEWRVGWIDAAETNFREAKSVAAWSIVPGIMRCTCLWRCGRYREARFEANELLARYRAHRKKIIMTRDVVDLPDAAEIFARMLGDFETAEQALRDAATGPEAVFDQAERHLSEAEIAFGRAEAQVHEQRLLRQAGAAACRSTIHTILSFFNAHPDEPRAESAQQIIGRAYLLLEDFSEAKKYLDDAVGRRPNTMDTLVAHGVLCLKTKDHVGAIRSFCVALARDPEDVSTRVLYANALFTAGDLEHSEVEARAVLSRAPGNVEAHLVLANINIELAEKGDADLYDEALRSLDAAWQLTGTVIGSKQSTVSAAAEIHNLRGFVYTRLYDRSPLDNSLLASAQQAFRKCLALDPQNWHALAALRKIGERRRSIRRDSFSDRLAGPTCALLALAVFVISAYRFWKERLTPGYSMIFLFGSMLFLIASFYLPQLLKLKVGTVELEKTSIDNAISKLPLQIRKTTT